jgi:hypothetical protein
MKDEAIFWKAIAKKINKVPARAVQISDCRSKAPGRPPKENSPRRKVVWT